MALPVSPYIVVGVVVPARKQVTVPPARGKPFGPVGLNMSQGGKVGMSLDVLLCALFALSAVLSIALVLLF
jgi:hypothetical protein